MSKIDDEFEDYIRNKLSDDQFWDWLKYWLDAELVIEMTENWDQKEKASSIKEFELAIKLNEKGKI
jgi:hypothetical protein